MAVTREEFEAKVKLLMGAGFAEESARKFAKEQLGEPEEKPKAEPLVKAAEQAGAVVAGRTEEVEVNIESFQRGGIQFFPPSGPGIWLSKLVDVTPPATGKDQRWFIFETTDPKLERQGKGAMVVDLGRGAWKLKDILDRLEIPYEVNRNRVKYTMSFPLGCKTLWQETTVSGRTQLRIQDVYHKEHKAEQVI